MNNNTKTRAGIRPSRQRARTRIAELLGVNPNEILPPKELATLITKATESSKHRLKLAKTLIANFSIIPIKPDGTKAPQLEVWKPFQSRKAKEAERTNWWGNGSAKGLAILGGAVSGNLFIFDFEDFDIFCKWLSKAIFIGYGDILKYCAMVLTPRQTGGVHLYLRLDFEPPGGEKFAMRPIPGQKKCDILIETRATGNYVLSPGSPAKCHSNNKTYELICGNPLDLPVIDKTTLDDLICLARFFDEREQKQNPPSQQEQQRDTNGHADFEAIFKELKLLSSPPDKELISDALSYIDADNYDDWVTIGMALKASGLPDKIAFQLWNDWSKTSPSQYAKNASGEMLRKWGSF